MGERRPDPRWACAPPEGLTCQLEVYKSGQLLDTLELSGGAVAAPKPCYLFGRTPVCDFVLDHASISRQHAFVGWDHTGQLLITDSSAHGTTINRTTPVAKDGVATKLPDGATITFGASSRSYVVKVRTREESEADARAEAEAKAAAPQEFRRLCAVQLVTTCGEGGETSASATFLGPPEVVRVSAVLLDTSHPLAPGAAPAVLGHFDELARPSANPLLSRCCCRLARTTQEAVDAADHLRSVLTKLVAWLDRNGCYGEGEGTEAAEGGGAGQKPVLAVTLGESALKRFLPRECLAAEMKLPAVLQDWVHLRTLFNCHTGLQKLTKAERRAADDDAGRSPVETEAEQMLASSTPWLHPCLRHSTIFVPDRLTSVCCLCAAHAGRGGGAFERGGRRRDGSCWARRHRSCGNGGDGFVPPCGRRLHCSTLHDPGEAGRC